MPYRNIHMNFGHKKTCLAVKKGYEATLFHHLGNPCALIHHQTGVPLNLVQIGGLKGSSGNE